MLGHHLKISAFIHIEGTVSNYKALFIDLNLNVPILIKSSK